MDIAVISFTQKGKALAGRIVKELIAAGHSAAADTRCAGEKEAIKETLSQWTAAQFKSKDALIFVGAAGIAVRAIAPYIKSKTEDPAVVVVDEAGRYCIPLLSGHIGGANELAKLLGARLQAEAVITTATDIRGKWAVDIFAAKNGLAIQDLKKAKEISARLLRGQNVSIDFQDKDVDEEQRREWIRETKDRFQEELVPRTGEDEPDISVGIRFYPEWKHTLYLIPRIVIAGIGCKKGSSARQIADAVGALLKKEQIWEESLCMAASIDIKAEEPGLLQYCREKGISLRTYSAKELGSVEGEFHSSGFVEKVTGVDNVCERSAVRAGSEECAGGAAHIGSKGRLIAGKQSKEGVTAALAVRERRL